MSQMFEQYNKERYEEISTMLLAHIEKDQKTLSRVYEFLAGCLGRDAVSEIPHLTPEDQVKACAEHIAIGLDVGDITQEDVKSLFPNI